MKLRDSSTEMLAAYRALAGRLDQLVPRNAASNRTVLLTAFGPFGEHDHNATIDIVRAFVDLPDEAPAVEVPTSTPEAVAASSLRYADGHIDNVDVRVAILPTRWDLAAAIALAHIRAVKPTLILMNGIGKPSQPMTVETAGRNWAKPEPDASNLISPASDAGEVLRNDAPTHAQPFRLAWQRVDARLGQPARADNAYLCNASAYLVSYALAHADEELRLLASDSHLGEVQPALPAERDWSTTGHAFIHWASDLSTQQRAQAAERLRAMVATQLSHADEFEVARLDAVPSEDPAL